MELQLSYFGILNTKIPYAFLKKSSTIKLR